jgi:hypothetical protein
MEIEMDTTYMYLIFLRIPFSRFSDILKFKPNFSSTKLALQLLHIIYYDM